MDAEQRALLPCPWCNPHGSAMPYRHAEGYWAVTCGCGAEGPARDSESDAITAWNTRALTQAQPGWRGIESAPRDGTRVLVVDNGGATVARYWNREWHIGDLPGKPAHPTCWMPLPAAPAPHCAPRGR